MSNYLVQIILTFIIANLMVILLLPGAYVFPKNLLDQLWLLKKTPKKIRTSQDNEQKILNYFYAADLLIFSSISYSMFSLFVSILVLSVILQVYNINVIIYIIIISIYGVWIGYGLKQGPLKKEKGEWPGRNFYVALVAIFTICVFVIVLVAALYKCYPQLVYWMWIMLAISLFFWLIPHMQYVPLMELIKLRNKQGHKQEEKVTEGK